MYVKCRPVAALYRGLVGALAVVATWSLFVMLGASAWRLFMTWALILASIYYIFSAIMTLIMIKWRDYGWTMLPTWQLATIIAFGLVFFECIFKLSSPLVFGSVSILIRLILPTMVLMDWVVFSKKGTFRLIDPWYTLALPACYAAWICLSADQTKLTPTYPYPFFDFELVTVPTFIWWLVLMMAVILLASYIIYVVDFVMSGKMAHYIVMPKLKLIEIEDDELTERTAKIGPVSEEKLKTAKTEPKTTSAKSTNPKVDIMTEAKKPAQTAPESKNKSKKTSPQTKDIKPSGKDKELKSEVPRTKVSEPKKPEVPKEPLVPNVPHIENRKKDLKSAQNLHGDHK